jgi:hypothetical protein
MNAASGGAMYVNGPDQAVRTSVHHPRADGTLENDLLCQPSVHILTLF